MFLRSITYYRRCSLKTHDLTRASQRTVKSELTLAGGAVVVETNRNSDAHTIQGTSSRSTVNQTTSTRNSSASTIVEIYQYQSKILSAGRVTVARRGASDCLWLKQLVRVSARTRLLDSQVRKRAGQEAASGKRKVFADSDSWLEANRDHAF